MEVEFDYTRSLGPVLARFMTALAERQVLGGRMADGRVVVPPLEFDPVTHSQVTELVPVADTGEVISWSWVSEPLPDQPLDRPFAYALVRLDGADVPFLHALDVASPDDVHTGMRVRARWAAERQGRITDIACFEVEGVSTALDHPEGALDHPEGALDHRDDELDHREGVSTELDHRDDELDQPADQQQITITPVRLGYDYAASAEESVFGRGLKEGRILAQGCPVCHKVYVPPRGACPVDGVPTSEPVELSDTGIVTTFCIVNVPYLGQKIQPPYVSAYVLLDGADIAFLHLILGCDAHDVRMGMRVKAVWKPEAERTFSLENISHFEPTGEPDADFDTYKKHL